MLNVFIESIVSCYIIDVLNNRNVKIFADVNSVGEKVLWIQKIFRLLHSLFTKKAPQKTQH